MEKILKITGTVALYACASMFLAMLLLAAYVSYAWKIDKSKRVRMIAIAQGHDLRDLQKAMEDRIAEMTYQEVLDLRAKRLRDEEFQQGTGEATVTEMLVADEKKLDEKLKKLQQREKTFDERIEKYMEDTRQTGLAEETRILEAAKAEFAKDALLRIMRERGDTKRVLQMLLAMEDIKRDKILYAMEDEAEKTELVDLLQRIGNGEPLADVIEDAKEEVKE